MLLGAEWLACVCVCELGVLEACPCLLLACNQSLGGFASCLEGTSGRTCDNLAPCGVIKVVHLLVLVVVEHASSDH